MSRQHFITSVVLLLTLNQGLAQRQVQDQSQFWARYQIKLKADRYTLRQDLDERVFWFPLRQHQFLLRTELNKLLKDEWNAISGLVYAIQSQPQDPTSEVIANQYEIRPYIGIAYTLGIAKNLSIQHRYLSELRYLKQESTFKYAHHRARFRIDLKYQIMEHLALGIHDEIFINTGRNITFNYFDQNRIGSSLEFRPNSSFAIDLTYFHMFQQRSTPGEYYSRHITRLSISHQLNIKTTK